MSILIVTMPSLYTDLQPNIQVTIPAIKLNESLSSSVTVKRCMKFNKKYNSRGEMLLN